MTRVYVPMNRGALAAALAGGEIGPVPVTAFAVMPELRAMYGEAADLEELEYAAYRLAVAASYAMLDPARPDDHRRLVAAADVAAIEPGDGGPGAVSVPDPIPWSAVASIHADTDDITDVEADPELAWFATQEAPDLLR